MKTVRLFKTTLSRQIGEAVRIMKRGGAGAILNSKSEFDRCKFPRMILEDQDEEESNSMEEQADAQDKKGRQKKILAEENKND